jgi:SAM-dependent methyltransferase
MHREKWGSEAGHAVVRCASCGLLYVHPMPLAEVVEAAVRTGQQKLADGLVNVRARHLPKKVRHYRHRLQRIISDVIEAGKPVHWVDVGCGYGELIDALQEVLPKGSLVEGVEPMTHKAAAAKARGLKVHNHYASFLTTVVSNLKSDGQFLMETGNLADLDKLSECPSELGLPDHLVFAGKPQIKRYLENAGLGIISIAEDRFDTVTQMAKNTAKLMLGRESRVRVPYTSRYRQMIVRARRIV